MLKPLNPCVMVFGNGVFERSLNHEVAPSLYAYYKGMKLCPYKKRHKRYGLSLGHVREGGCLQARK